MSQTPRRLPLVRIVEPCGHIHQIWKRAGLHLSHDLAPVSLHCDLAYAEFKTHLLVQQAGDDQSHHLLLAATERCMAILQRTHLQIKLKRGSAALQRLLDGAQQRVG